MSAYGKPDRKANGAARYCACGCGRTIDGRADQRFLNNAHRMRAGRRVARTSEQLSRTPPYPSADPPESVRDSELKVCALSGPSARRNPNSGPGPAEILAAAAASRGPLTPGAQTQLVEALQVAVYTQAAQLYALDFAAFIDALDALRCIPGRNGRPWLELVIRDRRQDAGPAR